MYTYKMILPTIFLLFGILHFGDAHQKVLYGSDETYFAYMKLLSIPQKPERYGPVFKKFGQSEKPGYMQYNWMSCGASTDPVKADVVLTPDPLPIPGDITIDANATLGVGLSSPLEVELTVQKKVLLTYITIPCVDDFGSCTYDDVCPMLEEAFGTGDCPEPFYSHKLPCKCPFAQGNYSLPPSVVSVENVNLPSWLTSGDYKAKAVLRNGSTGAELACYNVAVTLN